MLSTTLCKFSFTILAALLVASSLQITAASEPKSACSINFNGGECFTCRSFSIRGTAPDCAIVALAARDYFKDKDGNPIEGVVSVQPLKVSLNLPGTCKQQAAAFGEFSGVMLKDVFKPDACDCEGKTNCPIEMLGGV